MSKGSRNQALGPRDNSSGNGDGAQSRTRLESDMLTQIRRRLEQASRKQETLAEAREVLLIERERFRESAISIRRQRIQTGNAEASFMDIARQFHNDHGLSFPPALTAAFEKIQDERDSLGTMEADHLQAESELGGSEWTFMEKESDLYQYELLDLFQDDFLDKTLHDEDPEPPPSKAQNPLSVPPSEVIKAQYQDMHFDPPKDDYLDTCSHDENPTSPPLPTPNPLPLRDFENLETEHQLAVAEFQKLRKQFNALRPQQAKYLGILDDEVSQKRHSYSELDETRDAPAFISRYSDLLTEMTMAEVRVQQLKQDVMQCEYYASVMQPRHSDPVHLERQPTLTIETVKRAQTEGAVATLLDDFPNTKRRIRDWILDFLRTSAVEKRRYRNTLLEYAPDPGDESWEDWTTHYWYSDMSDSSLLSGRKVQDPSVTHHTSQCSDVDQASTSFGRRSHEDWCENPWGTQFKYFGAEFQDVPFRPVQELAKDFGQAPSHTVPSHGLRTEEATRSTVMEIPP